MVIDLCPALKPVLPEANTGARDMWNGVICVLAVCKEVCPALVLITST